MTIGKIGMLIGLSAILGSAHAQEPSFDQYRSAVLNNQRVPAPALKAPLKLSECKQIMLNLIATSESALQGRNEKAIKTVMKDLEAFTKTTSDIKECDVIRDNALLLIIDLDLAWSAQATK